MIANQILENKMINEYSKMYNIFAQDNTLKLNLSEDNIIVGLIQDVNSNNANSTYKKEILTPYNTLKTGDYITHNNVNYIIESQIDKEIACDKAYLLECPFSIKIFDWDYNNILEYPISLKNNNGKLGVTESAIAITANSSFDIILKYDTHTRSFVKGDNVINGIQHAKITRILLDGMAFKVVGVNHLISNGLLIISIENDIISPADNLELGVADYTTLYRESGEQIVDAEIFKYETTALIAKNILAGADVTSTIKKLKAGQTVNTDVNVGISAVNIDGLLTLTDGIIKLTNQIPYASTDNITTATLSFTKGTVTKTLIVNVTIEKQDNAVIPPSLVITGDTELWYGDTNTFSINTTEPVIWSISNTIVGVTLAVISNSNCEVSTIMDNKLIGKQEILTATVGGFNYTITIYITSRI